MYFLVQLIMVLALTKANQKIFNCPQPHLLSDFHLTNHSNLHLFPSLRLHFTNLGFACV